MTWCAFLVFNWSALFIQIKVHFLFNTNKSALKSFSQLFCRMKYKHPLQAFLLPSENAKQIFVLGEQPNYSLLRDLFANFIESTLSIERKPAFKNKLTLLLYCSGKWKKTYKLVCDAKTAFSEKDVLFEVWSQTNQTCSCGPAAHPQIRGKERNVFKQQLSSHLPKHVRRQAALSGGIIPTQKQLENMINENRSAQDLDQNVSLDLMKREIVEFAFQNLHLARMENKFKIGSKVFDNRLETS